MTGINNFKRMNIKSLCWLAYDKYEYSDLFNDGPLIPWGVGSVAFEVPGRNSSIHRAVIGGSYQIYYEGKRMGLASPLKVVTRENVTALLGSQSISLGPFLFVLYNEQLS